ncbi:MAG: hypothetical protein ACOYJJ_07455 [Anaerovoracaceae bacterium]
MADVVIFPGPITIPARMMPGPILRTISLKDAFLTGLFPVPAIFEASVTCVLFAAGLSVLMIDPPLFHIRSPVPKEQTLFKNPGRFSHAATMLHRM